LQGPREGWCWAFLKARIDNNTSANYIKLNVNDADVNGGATTEVIGFGYGLNSIDCRQTNQRRFQTRRWSLGDGTYNYENYYEGEAAITGSALFVDGTDIVFEQYYDFNPLDLFNPALDYSLWKKNAEGSAYTNVGLQSLHLAFKRDGEDGTSTSQGVWNSVGVPNNVTLKVIGGETQVVDKLNKGPRVQIRFAPEYSGYNQLVSWMQSFNTTLDNYKNGSNTNAFSLAMGFAIGDSYV
jgi:hypothetical protein